MMKQTPYEGPGKKLTDVIASFIELRNYSTFARHPPLRFFDVVWRPRRTKLRFSEKGKTCSKIF